MHSIDLEVNDLIENEDETNEANKKSKENEEGKVKPVRKKVPQVNLNAERLCGERGIPILPKIFSEIKFKGHGYEKQNLDKLLKTLGHWSHRLFPRMTFNDFIDRAEFLGTKRPVQTCVRKLRYGMPVLSEDFISEEVVDEPESPKNTVVVDDDEFDALFRDIAPNTFSNAPSSPIRQTYVSSQLTDEVRERISLNKRLALEKRAALLSKSADTSSTGPSTENASTSTMTSEWLTETELFDLMETDDCS